MRMDRRGAFVTAKSNSPHTIHLQRDANATMLISGKSEPGTPEGINGGTDDGGGGGQGGGDDVQSVTSRFSFSLDVGGPGVLSRAINTNMPTNTPTNTHSRDSRSLGAAQRSLATPTASLTPTATFLTPITTSLTPTTTSLTPTPADSCSKGEGERDCATAGGGTGRAVQPTPVLTSENLEGIGVLGEGETRAAVCLICKEPFRACRIALIPASCLGDMRRWEGGKAEEGIVEQGARGGGESLLRAGQGHWQLTCALCRAVVRGGGGRMGERRLGLSAQQQMQRRSCLHW